MNAAKKHREIFFIIVFVYRQENILNKKIVYGLKKFKL